MKPLLFLDVDGVINALDPHLDVESIERKGFTIRFQPWLRECLLELHEHFEVVWCTTWREDAEPSFAEVLGLPGTRDYVPWERRFRQQNGFKLPALVEYAGDRPWAFVDDDIEWELRSLLADRGEYAGVLIEPDSKVGITPDHTTQLVEYARSLCE